MHGAQQHPGMEEDQQAQGWGFSRELFSERITFLT